MLNAKIVKSANIMQTENKLLIVKVSITREQSQITFELCRA